MIQKIYDNKDNIENKNGECSKKTTTDQRDERAVNSQMYNEMYNDMIKTVQEKNERL